MPLPTPGTNWPPKPFDMAFDAIAEYDAWYRGDVDALRAMYNTASGIPQNRPSQSRGGIVGGIARMFWGRPIPQGQHRSKVHVPIAADVASVSSDLLFAEPPRIILPGGYSQVQGEPTASAAQERMNKIFNSPGVHSELLEAGEVASALTGAYLRAVWDKDLFDFVQVDSVPPDQAIPTWRHGRLSEVTFWEVLLNEDNGTVVRHFEHHAPGSITHAVYIGNKDNVGRIGSLGDYPSTAWAADLEGGIVQTKIRWLTAEYVPNIRPQREWRQEPQLYPMGRSDFSGGVLSLMDALDETMSSWMRDLRLGKARVYVPEQYLEWKGQGQGGVFDEDQEIFTSLQVVGKTEDGLNLTPYQAAIRWEEHQKTATELMRSIMRAAGLSPASFGDDAMPLSSTATEVKSKQQLSERTRDKKIMYWRAALGPFSRMLLALDATVYGTAHAETEIPDVKFTAKASQDTEELARTAGLLRTAEAASTTTLVWMVNPDWTQEQVDREVERILEEKKSSMGELADPTEVRGPQVDEDGEEIDPDEPKDDDEENEE